MIPVVKPKKLYCEKCGVPKPEHPNDNGWMMSFVRVLCPHCRNTDKEDSTYPDRDKP